LRGWTLSFGYNKHWSQAHIERVGDSPERLSQRKPAAHRESSPFSRPGRSHLRLGHLHHAAHLRGEAFAYERHWRRLEKDANLTHLPMPYTAAKVRVHLHEVIRANKVIEGCRASI